MNSSIWTPQSIIVLRKKLGWQQPDLARRLGCSVDIIKKIENGSLKPDKEICSQLIYLQSIVTQNARELSEQPVADSIIKDQHLDQLQDLEPHLKKDK